MTQDMSAKALLDEMVEEYHRKLTDLRGERKVLMALAARLGVELELGDLDVDEASPSKNKPLVLKSDQFFGMTQTGAVAAYLKLKGKPATMEDILSALKTGGLEIAGKDPRMNLYTQIIRATAKFVRLPNGEIGLVEWYPAVQSKRSGAGRKKKNGVVSVASLGGTPSDGENDAEEPEEDDANDARDGDTSVPENKVELKLKAKEK